jgi:hypothetical protein
MAAKQQRLGLMSRNAEDKTYGMNIVTGFSSSRLYIRRGSTLQTNHPQVKYSSTYVGVPFHAALHSWAWLNYVNIIFHTM